MPDYFWRVDALQPLHVAWANLDWALWAHTDISVRNIACGISAMPGRAAAALNKPLIFVQGLGCPILGAYLQPGSCNAAFMQMGQSRLSELARDSAASVVRVYGYISDQVCAGIKRLWRELGSGCR